VITPLLAGHGTRIEDLVGTTRRDWVASAAEPALEIVASGKRLHLVGLSMGGVIAVLLAPVFGAASLTTIDAPQRVRNWRTRFAWLMRGSTRIEPGTGEVPIQQDMVEYQQQYEGTPVGTVADLMDLVRAARRALPRVECPALVIQSLTDETVKPISGQIIFDHLGSARKRLLWLEHSRHVATLDSERDVLTAAVIDHLETTRAEATNSST